MDIAQLAERIGLDEEDYCELLELLLDSGAADIEKIRSGTEGNDMCLAAAGAHSLKGAAANLGLEELADTARRTEEAVADGGPDLLKQLLAKLEETLRAIASGIRNE